MTSSCQITTPKLTLKERMLLQVIAVHARHYGDLGITRAEIADWLHKRKLTWHDDRLLADLEDRRLIYRSEFRKCDWLVEAGLAPPPELIGLPRSSANRVQDFVKVHVFTLAVNYDYALTLAHGEPVAAASAPARQFPPYERESFVDRAKSALWRWLT